MYKAVIVMGALLLALSCCAKREDATGARADADAPRLTGMPERAEYPPPPDRMQYASMLSQGITILATDAAGLAGPSEPIYVACNLNNWRVDDPAYRMTRGADGVWRLDIPQADRPISYTFTRGSVETVEVKADLSKQPGRPASIVMLVKYADGSEKPEYRVSIEAWADQRSP